MLSLSKLFYRGILVFVVLCLMVNIISADIRYTVTGQKATSPLNQIKQFGYDKNGNATKVISSKEGIISYKYDELNRLTQESLLDGTTITYEYDATDNRTKKTVGMAVASYTYDYDNQLKTVNGQAYTYDANGNLVGNGAKTFVYDEQNRLKQVKNSVGNVMASFSYDHEGKRTSMIASGVTTYFHYSGDKVIYETDMLNNVTAEYKYDATGTLATMTKNGAVYYYHANGHGDITRLTDSNSVIVAQYTYDAWGNILSQSGKMASANPYRYAGYRYDESTGLYYLMSRYYDASVGRFITRDTVQTVNLYAYCEGNPVMYVDPTGHIAQTEVDAYKSGKLSQKVYDILMRLTNLWYDARTEGQRYFIHAVTEEFRKSNYTADIKFSGSDAFTISTWYGHKAFLNADASNKMAAFLASLSGISGAISVAASKIPYIGDKLTYAVGIKTGQLAYLSGQCWRGNAEGKGTVLIFIGNSLANAYPL